MWYFSAVKLIFLNRYFHPDLSATSQMLSGLAFHLASRGAEVHVITSRQRYGDPSAQLAAEETISGVRVHRVLTSRFGRRTLPGRALDYASFYLWAAAKLAALAQRGDIVVAKTDPPLISVPALLVTRLRGARLVNWLQDLFPEAAERMGLRLPGITGLARAARDASLRGAEINVVLGELMRKQVEKIPGAPRSTVIHNWADSRNLVPVEPTSNPLRSAWGLDGKFVVAYSGNMGRAHEFDTILEAAGKLRSQPSILFLLIGDGHHRDRIAALARERGLSDLQFRPYQPAELLSQSLGSADVHLTTLLPALEGLIVPSKLYGILAAGRPAIHIGDPEGEVGRILETAQCGFAVPPGDASLLAKRLVELSSNPQLVAHLGRNARTAFEASFSEQIAFRHWENLLLAIDAAALGRASAQVKRGAIPVS